MRPAFVVLASLAVVACSAERLSNPARRPSNANATIFPGSEVVYLGSLRGIPVGSYAFALNAQEQIVGWSEVNNSVRHAFLWDDGVMQDLGTLGDDPSLQSVATAINASGVVVGYGTLVVGSNDAHAFLWQLGSMQDLGTLGGRTSIALGINDVGQVVGQSQTSTGENHAFLWENGTMRDLGTLVGGASSAAAAINASGLVAGTSESPNGPRAVVWRDGVIQELASSFTAPFFTRAQAINSAGQVAGEGGVGGRARVLLWQPDGVMEDLGNFGFINGLGASAINDAGQIVGYSFSNEGLPRAFFWSAADGMEDLTALTGLHTAHAIDGSNVVGDMSNYFDRVAGLVRLRLQPLPP